jgi:protocatechuate 3,4-dioxygenase beta subunit
MIEIWQADTGFSIAPPIRAATWLTGIFAALVSDTVDDGQFWFKTIKPGVPNIIRPAPCERSAVCAEC